MFVRILSDLFTVALNCELNDGWLNGNNSYEGQQRSKVSGWNDGWSA